jgi:hypothetical protein
MHACGKGEQAAMGALLYDLSLIWQSVKSVIEKPNLLVYADIIKSHMRSFIMGRVS